MELTTERNEDIKIRVDDLSSLDVAAFLGQHLEDMNATSPPESMHALDLDSLRSPAIVFWTMRSGSHLLGCGAIKALDSRHAEIKSMRTSPEHRGNGLGTAMLKHILNEAKQRGYCHLSLETGSTPFFEPARKLYEKFGFDYCPPFAGVLSD